MSTSPTPEARPGTSLVPLKQDGRVPAVFNTVKDSELAYTRDVYQALVTERKHSVGWLVLVLTLMLGALITWASLTEVEEITRGEAKIIPTTREQVIQSLEGGIISELYVREGMIVTAGQPLVRIDPTKAQSSLMEDMSTDSPS